MTIKGNSIEEMFAYVYVRNGYNATKAIETVYEKTGKKKTTYKTLKSRGHAFLNKEKVQELIEQFEYEFKLEQDQEFYNEKRKIINAMWKVYDKSMEEQKAYDRNGRELDGYAVNSITGANKALESLAKAIGLFVDKVETKNENTNLNIDVIEVEID